MVCQSQPSFSRLNFASWPKDRGEPLHFRLVYQGELPADTGAGGKTRRIEKHDIRKIFHKQLAEFWKQHNFLRTLRDHEQYESGQTYMHDLSARFSRCGFKFAPLITKHLNLACELEILFLRRDAPGNLIRSGGDIDNRIKTLLDALRMPQNCDEVRGFAPEPDESPFFCVLEDDSLITDIAITTDQLLVPVADGEHIHDVQLVVKVITEFIGSI